MTEVTDRDMWWLAELECPIPARISPYADAVQDWLLGWVQRCGGPLDASFRSRLAGAGVARYAGRLYPDASEADLRVLTALFTWFFLLDDACDGAGQPRSAEVSALCAAVLRLLRAEPPAGPDAPTGPNGSAEPDALACPHPMAGPLGRMLADAWRVPRARMTAAWRHRFVDAVAHHLNGVVTEAVNKATGRRPTVPEYVELRRATSAAYVSYTLIEFATGEPVPDAVYHHPAVRAVAATANDLLSWFNDLLSLPRDELTAGGHNLVLAVARDDGISVEEAVRVVVRRWRETMRRFGELRAAVPSFGAALDGPLRRHLDGLAYSVRGTIDWSLESARYVRPPALRRA